jgi:hypothetical protein
MSNVLNILSGIIGYKDNVEDSKPGIGEYSHSSEDEREESDVEENMIGGDHDGAGVSSGEQDHKDTRSAEDEKQTEYMDDNTVNRVTLLTLHKDFNVTQNISALDNCTLIYTKLGFEEPNNKMSRANYLNQLVKTKKKTENFAQIALEDDGDEDFGLYSASDLVEKNHQKKEIDKTRQSSNFEELVVYEEVELKYFTVIEMYNPYGMLLQEEISDSSYKEWYTEFKGILKKRAKIGAVRDAQLAPILPKKLQSAKFFRSNSILEDSKERGKCVVVCLQQPVTKSGNDGAANNPLNFSKDAAHNEGIYYIMIYAVFPEIEKQLCSKSTRISNKKMNVVKKVARTDKFITSLWIKHQDREDEICRYVSTIDCFADDFVGTKNATWLNPKQLVGMYYYQSEKDSWFFRATNDFALQPPSLFSIKVLDTRNIQYLINSKQHENTSEANVENANKNTEETDKILNQSNKNCDTYCSVSYNNKKVRGKTIYRNAHPQYSDQYQFQLVSEETLITIEIFQAFALSSELIGSTTLSLNEIFGNDRKFKFEMRKSKRKRRGSFANRFLDQRPVLVHERWYSLTPGNAEKEIGVAKINVLLMLEWE